MDIGKLLMRITLILLVLASCFGACSYLNRKAGLDDDNIVEEAVEALIEARTGIEIDLTP